MYKKHSNIAKLILLLLIVAGQWVYAAHDIASLDENHHHNAECITCAFDYNTGTCPSAPATSFFEIVATQSALPLEDIFAAAVSRNTPIRAPPANH